ncbi:MAG TPA: ATP-binding protein [Chitinophagaceae bacterium]
MFSFTFQNPYGFLCAFIPALLNLALVVYILIFLPRNRITNVFALATLACALWQITDAFVRITVTAAAADFWDSVLSISWIFIGPLCIHFTLLYTQMIKSQSRIYIPLLYAPGFIFLALYQGHYYEHPFQYTPFWGWGNLHNRNVIDIIQVYWASVLAFASLILLCIYTFKIKSDQLLKHQSLLITIGIAVPTITAIITQVIFLTVFQKPPITLTSTLLTFFSIATVLALKKYKLFSVSDLINNRTILDSMPLIVFSVSKKKRITYMNHFGLQTLGLTMKELSAIDINELFFYESKDHEKKMNEVWKRTVEYEQVENIESSFNTPKGKIDIILSYNPIINNNKVEGVLFTARDMTELKKSNQLLIKKEKMLEEAQRLSHIGSWEWDVLTNTVLWSDELYRIYGYKPGEIPITYESYLQNLHPGDREFVNGIIQKAYNDHQPFNFYHRILRNDGTEVVMYAQGEVTVDKDNNIIRMTGTGQDVTELKTQEAILKNQNEELQKINAELDKFVYSVTHDLRAPLTSMLGVVEIAEEDNQDILMKKRLTLLKTNIRKLDQFILDIMDYSLNARQEIKKEEINFQSVLDEITHKLKYINDEGSNVDIRVKIISTAPFHSDKSRISIMLNNLISNSIRYCNPKVNDPFVEIGVNVTDKEANIIISDNGIGIGEEFHDKIFDMFYRVSHTSMGTGLGLYLVKESVKKLNGRIKVESQKEKGSKFSICIPND